MKKINAPTICPSGPDFGGPINGGWCMRGVSQGRGEVGVGRGPHRQPKQRERARLNIYTWPERTANTVPVVRPALPPPPAQAALSKKIAPGGAG